MNSSGTYINPFYISILFKFVVGHAHLIFPLDHIRTTFFLKKKPENNFQKQGIDDDEEEKNALLTPGMLKIAEILHTR